MSTLFETQHIILLIGSLLIGYMIHYIFKNKFNEGYRNNENKNLLLPRVVSYRIPWIGSAISYGKNPTKFLSECREEYGEVFTLKLAGKSMIFVLDPHVVSQVSKDKNFVTSSFVVELVENMFGIRKSSIKKILHQARHTQKYLSGGNLLKLIESTKVNLVDTILNKIKSNKEEWKQGHLHDFIARTLWVSVTETVFGKGFTEEEMWDDFQKFDNGIPILASGVPKIFVWAALKSRRKLGQLFTKERLFNENESEWITSRNKEFIEKLDQEQFMSIQISVIWAAVANTVPTAFWTIANIISNPHIKMRCEQEIEKFTKVDSKTKRITFIDLDKFIYVNACITEALRLNAVPLLVRDAVEDSKIHIESLNQTYLIKKGESVAFYPRLTHLDPEIYGNDANEYNPSRFLPNEDGSKKIFMKNGKVVKLHLTPFGFGSQLCPGRYFAREDIKLFVIYFLYYIDSKLHDKLPDANVKRAGLGVWDPLSDIKFEYRLRQHIQD